MSPSKERVWSQPRPLDRGRYPEQTSIGVHACQRPPTLVVALCTRADIIWYPRAASG